MTQAARLLQLGQKAHAVQFPATITIDGESYDVSTSGEKKERDLISGGWLAKASIAFWLPVSAFADAEADLPVERMAVTLTSQAGVATDVAYVIASISYDAARTTITLRCETPEQ